MMSFALSFSGFLPCAMMINHTGHPDYPAEGVRRGLDVMAEAPGGADLGGGFEAVLEEVVHLAKTTTLLNLWLSSEILYENLPNNSDYRPL